MFKDRLRMCHTCCVKLHLASRTRHVYMQCSDNHVCRFRLDPLPEPLILELNDKKPGKTRHVYVQCKVPNHWYFFLKKMPMLLIWGKKFW